MNPTSFKYGIFLHYRYNRLPLSSFLSPTHTSNNRLLNPPLITLRRSSWTISLYLCASFLHFTHRERDAAETKTKTNISLIIDMASSKHSFGFGVMAIIATLIFTISFPAAVQAQTLAPAPSPTSDGNFLSLSLFLLRSHLLYQIYFPRSGFSVFTFYVTYKVSISRYFLLFWKKIKNQLQYYLVLALYLFISDELLSVFNV